MKTRRILSLVLFLLFLASCAGNAPNTEDPPPPLIRVGFSQVGSESDWRLANTKSMTNALSEENGFELLFDNARQKQENQFLAIRNFIQQEVDYIVIAPISSRNTREGECICSASFAAATAALASATIAAVT